MGALTFSGRPLQFSDVIGSSFEGAMFSADRRHRYTLWRRWWVPDGGGRLLAFCGLNPSTADETKNDPTVKRCINRAKRMGYDGMIMLNIFAYRSTDPHGLLEVPDPVGELNDEVLRVVAGGAAGVLACWGTHGTINGRGAFVLKLLKQTAKRLSVLDWTKDGHPKHPLYHPSLCRLHVFEGIDHAGASTWVPIAQEHFIAWE